MIRDAIEAALCKLNDRPELIEMGRDEFSQLLRHSKADDWNSAFDGNGTQPFMGVPVTVRPGLVGWRVLGPEPGVSFVPCEDAEAALIWKEPEPRQIIASNNFNEEAALRREKHYREHRK